MKRISLKKILINSSLFLILIIVVIFFLFFLNNNRKPLSPELRYNYAIFESNEYKFSFKYPNTWGRGYIEMADENYYGYQSNAEAFHVFFQNDNNLTRRIASFIEKDIYHMDDDGIWVSIESIKTPPKHAINGIEDIVPEIGDDGAISCQQFSSDPDVFIHTGCQSLANGVYRLDYAYYSVPDSSRIILIVNTRFFIPYNYKGFRGITIEAFSTDHQKNLLGYRDTLEKSDNIAELMKNKYHKKAESFFTDVIKRFDENTKVAEYIATSFNVNK